MNLSTFLFAAGTETTTKLVSSAMRVIAENPEYETYLREDRSRIPAFLEETLRMESPVKSHFRMARTSTTIGDVEVPAGTTVMLLPGACNRDARKFDDPDTFRPDRRNVREQIAFIRGVHSCPGAPLARTEGRISLNRILDRMTDFRVSEEHHGPAERAGTATSRRSSCAGWPNCTWNSSRARRIGAYRYVVHMSRLAVNYASRLAGAYLLSITAAVAILIPLGGEALHRGAELLHPEEHHRLCGVGRRRHDRGHRRRRAEHHADAALVRSRPGTGRSSAKSVDRMLARQSVILAGTWVVSGAVSVLLNIDGGVGIVVPTALGVVLGGSAASGIGLLLTHEHHSSDSCRRDPRF